MDTCICSDDISDIYTLYYILLQAHNNQIGNMCPLLARILQLELMYLKCWFCLLKMGFIDITMSCIMQKRLSFPQGLF